LGATGRQYEALLGYMVERLSVGKAAERFGYSADTIYTLARHALPFLAGGTRVHPRLLVPVDDVPFQRRAAAAVDPDPPEQVAQDGVVVNEKGLVGPRAS